MEILTQILIIFGICLAGEGIAALLPFAFPSSVISMLLLLLLLALKMIKTDRIKSISEFLLQNMAFFFIPAGAGILEKYTYLKCNILILLLISLITMILTFMASAFTVTAVMRLQTKLQGKRKKDTHERNI